MFGSDGPLHTARTRSLHIGSLKMVPICRSSDNAPRHNHAVVAMPYLSEPRTESYRTACFMRAADNSC